MLPVPRQQGNEVARVFIDAREYICQPRLRVGAFQADGLDQRVHHHRALAATIQPGKQPSFPTQRDAA